MPEGHTLHRIARDLHAAFAGRVVSVSSPQGRFAAGAALLDDHEVIEARAHGKHLFVEFAGEQVLHVHLGLIGTFTIDATAYVGERPVVGQVRCRIATEDHHADLRGPMRCAVITPDEEAAVHAKLGPDPLRDVDGGAAWERIHRSRTSIAALLMEQDVIAGIGNVYRCELCFVFGLDPRTPVRAVPDLERMVRRARQMLHSNRNRTIRNTTGDTRPGRNTWVYGRRGPCRRCGTTIRYEHLGPPGRERPTYWCPSCQPPVELA